jgi:aryl-alcohol dehydrogenase-like predicted oxidoreductase
MKYHKLGHSNIDVSAFCLGTMTFGTQTSEADAHTQIDLAREAGINFLDTAEAYPTTPSSLETAGRTEEIIGNWLGAHKSERQNVILASKAAGEGSALRPERADGKRIRVALDGSLQRLQSDYIDLYQLHWPNRGSYHFRSYWDYDPSSSDVGDMDQEIADILGEVAKLVDEGKLRYFGLSNETAWGTMRFLEVAKKHNLPRIVSIQNEYSLICRVFDLDLAELSMRENTGLIAYSPLAAGLLTCKYANGALPPGSRMTLQPDLNRRATRHSLVAAESYGKIARKHGMTPAQMALAFCLTRPFMTSTIIGTVSLDQLHEILPAAEIVLSEEILDEITETRRGNPMPM